MKKLLLLLIIPLLSFGQTEQYKEYHPNGKLALEGQQINGKDEGLWRGYSANGQLIMAINFKNGKMEGEYKSFYETGQLSMEGFCKNDIREGVWKYYYENGKLERKENLKNGEVEGIIEYYYENGKLQRIGSVKDGKEYGTWKYYYKNGKLQQELNKEKGYSRQYYKNGQLKRETYLKKGVTKCWDENGIEFNCDDIDFVNTNKPKITNTDDNVYFDTDSRIYSHFKYGISFKEKRGWEIDYGLNKHTIFRAFDEDNAYTFSINVIELDLESKDYLDAHQLCDIIGGEEVYNKAIIGGMKQQQAPGIILEPSTTKTYFKGFPVLKTTFSSTVIDENGTLNYKDVMYVVMRKNYQIIFGLSAPEFLYIENQDDLNNIFDDVNLIYH